MSIISNDLCGLKTGLKIWALFLLVWLISWNGLLAQDDLQGLLPDSTQVQDSLVWGESLDNPNLSELQQEILVIPELKQEDIFFYRGLNEEPRDKKKEEHTFFFFYFCTMLTILGFVLTRFPEHMNAIRRSFSNFRIARIYYEDDEYSNNLPILLMHIVHLMLAGGLVYILLQKVEAFDGIPATQLVPFCFLLSAVLFAIRYFALSFLSKIFPDGKYFGFFLYNQVILQVIMSIVCIPFLMFYIYVQILPSEWFGMMIIGVILTFFLYLFYRGIVIATPIGRMRPFHFILYLCAFEIAPLVLLFGLYREVAA